jgi:tagaturonate reductase
MSHLPTLSPEYLRTRPDLGVDVATLAALSEKVIQFGTGVLLRGLPDYFIHKANQRGIFNGRIVVVKSTSRGGVDAFAKQGNVFTHVIKGIEKGEIVEETLLNTAISRTLSAQEEWGEILRCAQNPDLQVVISNTTEVGIQWAEDDLNASPPASFPAKLTAFLYERFRALGGSAHSGLVIVPTELVTDNGSTLRQLVLRHAEAHQLGEAFRNWLVEYNYFCNSLVDRIVPGKPNAEALGHHWEALGYVDELLIESEVYRLWAIEGNEAVRDKLSFAQADAGVVIAPSIDLFRELKLRLLNGTHTLAVGYCYLAGLDTVRESMENTQTARFIERLMLDELAPAIPYAVDTEQAQAFGQQVLDRFRNPYIRHQLLDITVQYTAKMRMRNIPTLLQYVKLHHQLPPLFVAGFAAYLHFMKAVKEEAGQYYGEREGILYPIRCDAAAYFYAQWQANAQQPDALVRVVLSNTDLWGTDLSAVEGLAGAVISQLSTRLQIQENV